MAEKTHEKLERIYVIPLREACMRVPSYKKARKAVVTIKEFIAKHMKVADRDTNKVKLDVYLNNDIWFRGPRNAPSKVKVKAVKEGEIVHVTFAEIPEFVKFAQAKHEKLHKRDGKKQEKVEEKKEEKTEEDKKAEEEKEKSSAIAKEQIAEQHAQAQKHTTKAKETQIHRMALKK